MSKFVKREDYQGADQALLKFGKAEPSVKGKDALVDYLKKVGAADEFVEKAADETGDVEVFPFVLSNANADREGDSINQDGWDLTNYRKNPVVLWAHDYAEEPVGRAAMVFVGKDGSLRAVDRFHDVTDRARTVAELYRQRILNAVSVGFRATDWAFSEERGGFAIDFKAQELLEHSAVPVPAHPEALLEARSAGMDLTPLREFYEQALDTNGFLYLPKSAVESAWKASADRRVLVDFGDKAAPAISAYDPDPCEAAKALDTTDLVKELTSRGLNVSLVVTDQNSPVPEKSEDKNTTKAPQVEELLSNMLADFRQEAKSVVSEFSGNLSKLKTDLTGRLD